MDLHGLNRPWSLFTHIRLDSRRKQNELSKRNSNFALCESGLLLDPNGRGTFSLVKIKISSRLGSTSYMECMYLI